MRSPAALRPSRLLALFFVCLAMLAGGCAPKIGDSCATSTDCSRTGDRLCDTLQPGGYCTKFACDPGSCPDEAVCVGFFAEICDDPRRPPRFERSFCMASCGSDDDCRSGYACLEVVAPEQIVDLSPTSRRVCMVRPVPRPPPVSDGDGGICSLSDAGSQLPDASPDGAGDGAHPDAAEAATDSANADAGEAAADTGADVGIDVGIDVLGDAADAGADAPIDASDDAADDAGG